MNERTLLIMAAVGATVVAYAVYALMTRAAVEDQPAPARTVEAAAAEPGAARGHADEAAEPTPRLPRINPAGGRRSADEPAGGPPPAVPMPEISLEEAREDYDDFIAELERELKRNEDTGKPLANEHWVEYYRRGHEVMDPLRRYMSSGTEAQRKEVGELDEALRALMSKLQRDPVDLEATEH